MKAAYLHVIDSGRMLNRGKPGERIFRHRFIMLASAQRRNMFDDVLVWLLTHVGPEGDNWLTNSLGDVHLGDDTTAFAFKLRWC